MGIARARHLAKDRHEKIAAAQRRAIEGPLPDFVVLGTQKGGTSFFYRLLTEHPLVRGAAAKELHFFDNKFAEGVGWYRRCFSEGKRVDGQRTITGEASPSYLFDPQVPERMAQIVPGARLMVAPHGTVVRLHPRPPAATSAFAHAIWALRRVAPQTSTTPPSTNDDL
jgi:hypothetical protein